MQASLKDADPRLVIGRRTPARSTPGLLLIILLLALAGCATGPKTPAELRQHPDAQRAQALAAQGDALAAAALYRSLALDVAKTPDADLLLRAAELYLQGGAPAEAGAVLAVLQPLPLTATEALRRDLIAAERRRLEGDPQAALAQLQSEPDATLPGRLVTQFYRRKAELLQQLEQPLAAARAYAAADARISLPPDRLDNQTALMTALGAVDVDRLRVAALQADPVWRGWLELDLALRMAGPLRQARIEAASRWRTQHPQHPALAALTERLLPPPPRLPQARQIAVLLPTSGSLAAAGGAVRDGILAAWYQQPAASRPALQFYDSSAIDQTWPLVNQAIDEGADLVLGPLQKDAVAQLLNAGELRAPVIALNEIEADRPTPANLFQFGLSPEDEGIQAAERAATQGMTRALIIQPEAAWGERIANAFAARWEQLGGAVAGRMRYAEDQADHGTGLQTVLHLDQSRERHRAVSQALGQRPEFEPRRRADVDLVLLVARQLSARQIRPQLQYHRAADLPVIATSRVWDGDLDRQSAPDLTGIVVPDQPWMLRTAPADAPPAPLSRASLRQLWPAAGGGLGRLYAFGLDAFGLSRALDDMLQGVGDGYDGATGTLTLGSGNRIGRRLAWGRLGQPPQWLGYTPQPPEPGQIRPVPAADRLPTGPAAPASTPMAARAPGSPAAPL